MFNCIQWICKRRTFWSQKTTPDDGGVAIRRLKCLTQRFVPDQNQKLSLSIVALYINSQQEKLSLKSRAMNNLILIRKRMLRSIRLQDAQLAMVKSH